MTTDHVSSLSMLAHACNQGKITPFVQPLPCSVCLLECARDPAYIACNKLWKLPHFLLPLPSGQGKEDGQPRYQSPVYAVGGLDVQYEWKNGLERHQILCYACQNLLRSVTTDRRGVDHKVFHKCLRLLSFFQLSHQNLKSLAIQCDILSRDKFVVN